MSICLFIFLFVVLAISTDASLSTWQILETCVTTVTGGNSIIFSITNRMVSFTLKFKFLIVPSTYYPRNIKALVE